MRPVCLLLVLGCHADVPRPPPPQVVVAAPTTARMAGATSWSPVAARSPQGDRLVVTQLGRVVHRVIDRQARELVDVVLDEDVFRSGMADADGDGDEDVIVIEHGVAAIALDVATGAEVWRLPLTFPSSASPVLVDRPVFVDLDGDGTDEVAVLRDVDRGTRSRIEVYGMGGQLLDAVDRGGRINGLSVAQLDIDPGLELIADGEVFEGVPLAASSVQGVPTQYNSLAFDTDGDGIDTVVGRGTTGVMAWEPVAGFRWAWNDADYATAFEDLDGDGTCEALLGVDGGHVVLDGHTGVPLLALDERICARPSPMDVDGDGTRELLCSGNASWYTFPAGVFVDLNTAPPLGDLHLTDLDGDGVEELLSVRHDFTHVLDPVSLDPVTTDLLEQRHAELWDVDQDGTEELVTTGNGLTFHEWSATTGFVPTVRPPFDNGTFADPVFADLTGDPVPELVSVHDSRTRVFDLGAGFELWSNASRRFDVADLDGDGTAEVITGYDPTIREGATGAALREVQHVREWFVFRGAGDLLVVRPDRDPAVLDVYHRVGNTVPRRASVTIPGLQGQRVQPGERHLWFHDGTGLVGWSPFDGTRLLLDGAPDADVHEVDGVVYVGGAWGQRWELP
jgi:hypothetical protein